MGVSVTIVVGRARSNSVVFFSCFHAVGAGPKARAGARTGVVLLARMVKASLAKEGQAGQEGPKSQAAVPWPAAKRPAT